MNQVIICCTGPLTLRSQTCVMIYSLCFPQWLCRSDTTSCRRFSSTSGLLPFSGHALLLGESHAEDIITSPSMVKARFLLTQPCLIIRLMSDNSWRETRRGDKSFTFVTLKRYSKYFIQNIHSLKNRTDYSTRTQNSSTWCTTVHTSPLTDWIQIFCVFLPWRGCCWSCRCRSLAWGSPWSSCEGRRTENVSERSGEEREAELGLTGTGTEEEHPPGGSSTSQITSLLMKSNSSYFISCCEGVVPGYRAWRIAAQSSSSSGRRGCCKTGWGHRVPPPPIGQRSCPLRPDWFSLQLQKHTTRLLVNLNFNNLNGK